MAGKGKLHIVFGESGTLPYFAKKYGLHRLQLQRRVYKTGMTLEEAIKKPIIKSEKAEACLNKIYGKVLCKQILYRDKYGRAICIFKCLQDFTGQICGNEFESPLICVKENAAKSCGCYAKFIWNKNGKHESIHWKGFGEIGLTFFNSIKNGAISRNIQFDITIEQIWKLFLKQDRKCSFSGIDLYFPYRQNNRDGNASLDRIDSLKGYTIDNIQWVHRDINLMKMAFPDEIFIKYCRLITEYNNE